MHKTVASTVGQGLTWPNVVWKLVRGATMTDKEIRSDEAAVVQRPSEEALRDSEKRYRTMIGNLPGFVYRCQNDRDWTMSFMSDGCRDITGYAPEDFLHNKKLAFNDIIRQDYRERVWLNIQNCVQQKKAFEHEYPIVVASGETDHWVWERGRGIFSDAGQLFYIEGFISDITDRKRAEEEIQRERAFFDRLVESAPESIAIADTQGRILRVNAEFVRMFGYGADEAVGQCLDDLVAPPARQEEARAITRSTSQGEKILLETVRRRKDGTLVDVSLIGASILVAGKPEAVYAIYRDITERKASGRSTERKRRSISCNFRPSCGWCCSIEYKNRTLCSNQPKVL